MTLTEEDIRRIVHEEIEARDKIRAAFNLTDPNLHVTFERGIHLEIGMGYGE